MGPHFTTEKTKHRQKVDINSSASGVLSGDQPRSLAVFKKITLSKDLWFTNLGLDYSQKFLAHKGCSITFSGDRCDESQGRVEWGWGSSEWTESRVSTHPRATPAESHTMLAAPETV